MSDAGKEKYEWPSREVLVINRQTILQLVEDGECSCQAVEMVMGADARQRYCDHSGARVKSTGFHHIHPIVWDTLPNTTRAQIREERLVDWFLSEDGIKVTPIVPEPIQQPARPLLSRAWSWIKRYMKGE